MGCLLIGSKCKFGLKTITENPCCLANSSQGNTLPRTSPLLMHTDRAQILKLLKYVTYPALTAPVPCIKIRHLFLLVQKSLLTNMLLLAPFGTEVGNHTCCIQQFSFIIYWTAPMTKSPKTSNYFYFIFGMADPSLICRS